MTTSQRFDRRPRTTYRLSLEAEIPTLSFHSIAQTEVFQRLSAAVATREARVLIICAPAGSGKTVAIADWLERGVRARHEQVTTGWVTATESIDSAAKLYTAVRAGLGFTAAPHDELPDPLADAAADILAVLAMRATPTVLVLDDAHRITDPAALAGLEYLLAHAPSTLTVVIAARHNPPIRWHPLELRGRLVRINGDDLALTAAQARELCAQHGCTATDYELETIMSLTRGWAALVRITAMHLAARADDRAAALTTLARPARAISDFLRGEIIDGLDADTVSFLTRTCIPDACTAQLAQVLAGPDAGLRLAELERRDFPIAPIVRGEKVWFRYHPMLRAHLLAEAQRTHPELLPELHARTAQWLLAANEPLAALPHLVASPDPEPLLNFLRDNAFGLILDGCGEALLRDLEPAGPLITDDAFIWLLRAVNAIATGEIAEGRAYVELVRARGVDTESLAPAAWLRSILDAATTESEIAGDAAPNALDTAVDLASTGQPDIDCYAAVQLATVRIFQGAVVESERALQHSLALAEQRCHPTLVLRSISRLALAAGLGGAITTMSQRADRARRIAVAHRLEKSADALHATAMVALARYWQGREPEPRPVALPQPSGGEGSDAPVGSWHAHLIDCLLSFEAATCDRYAAAEALRDSLSRLLGGAPAVGTAGPLIAPAVWALLRVNEPRLAQALVDRAGSALGERPEVVVARATITEVANKPKSTRSLLAPILDPTVSMHPVSSVTAWLLDASASDRLGHPHRVRQSLENALRRGVTEELIRPFLDVPAALPLLDTYTGRFGHFDAFADRIRHHPAARRPEAQPVLTTTELSVLRLLPSGRTAQQISEDLGVSINTVKTHLRGIYAKLGTNTRGGTLDRARHTGII